MITKIKELPLPAFYNPANAADWGYRPSELELMTAAFAWDSQHQINANALRRKIHVLGIDLQKSFCYPEGTLFVGGRSGDGAIKDNERFAEFVYRNLAAIDDMTLTMDTHFVYQLFFAPFWQTQDGQPLQPHTLIKVVDDRLANVDLLGNVIHADVVPRPAIIAWACNGNHRWAYDYLKHYCSQLEKEGKYTLYLWPPHCQLGSEGHALAGVIYEAHVFFSLIRGRQNLIQTKGSNVFSESYSVLRDEVLLSHDRVVIGQKNTKFIETLLRENVVIIGGQASSHCVKSTIFDLLNEILDKDASLAKKVYILGDCMSAVAIPDGNGGFHADFTEDAEKALQEFRDKGMNVVKSTDPIETWPGVVL